MAIRFGISENQRPELGHDFGHVAGLSKAQALQLKFQIGLTRLAEEVGVEEAARIARRGGPIPGYKISPNIE